MSKIQSERITCPNCGIENEVSVIQSINTSITPELRDKFLNGDINKISCSSCDFTYLLDTPVLYNDMKNEFAVLFQPGGISDELKNDWNSKKHFVPYFNYACFMTDNLKQARLLIRYCEAKAAPKSISERDTLANEMKIVGDELDSQGREVDWQDMLTNPAAPDADISDELYARAKEVVLQHDKASPALLQRKLQIDYDRAGGLVSMLEINGIVHESEDGYREVIRENESSSSGGPAFALSDVKLDASSRATDDAVVWDDMNLGEKSIDTVIKLWQFVGLVILLGVCMCVFFYLPTIVRMLGAMLFK